MAFVYSSEKMKGIPQRLSGRFVSSNLNLYFTTADKINYDPQLIKDPPPRRTLGRVLKVWAKAKPR